MRKSDAKAEKVKKAKEKKKELDREIKKKAGEMFICRCLYRRVFFKKKRIT